MTEEKKEPTMEEIQRRNAANKERLARERAEANEAIKRKFGMGKKK